MQTQTAKESIVFKLNHYEIDIKPCSEKRLAISIMDPILRAEFAQKDLPLQIIGVNTLVKALEQKKKQITARIDYQKLAENQILSITVKVESAFLKPIEETFYLKKIRDISDTQLIQKKLNFINKKLKDIKAGNGDQALCSYYGQRLEQKSYYSNNATYEPLCQIQLPKGKYLLTFSFMLKANNQWLYLYFGNGGAFMTNCGFYVPASGQYMHHTVRKVHTVTGNSEKASFTSYSTQSYPVTLKNSIITAKRID